MRHWAPVASFFLFDLNLTSSPPDVTWVLNFFFLNLKAEFYLYIDHIDNRYYNIHENHNIAISLIRFNSMSLHRLGVFKSEMIKWEDMSYRQTDTQVIVTDLWPHGSVRNRSIKPDTQIWVDFLFCFSNLHVNMVAETSTSLSKIRGLPADPRSSEGLIPRAIICYMGINP